jgi:D-glycerate 3-kinase
LVIEGWLMGCQALGPEALGRRLQNGRGLESLTAEEKGWLPRWDRALEAYGELWVACDGLWLMRPENWSLPRRWRFQAEARQRRLGGGWLPASRLDGLVRASLHSLPPALYQDPLLAGISKHKAHNVPELEGAVILDGRRRCRPLPLQLEASSWASSATG